jgi:Holliday junction resolvasome RuvABC ATP-dependent DNA helicase subunit
MENNPKNQPYGENKENKNFPKKYNNFFDITDPQSIQNLRNNVFINCFEKLLILVISFF